MRELRRSESRGRALSQLLSSSCRLQSELARKAPCVLGRLARREDAGVGPRPARTTCLLTAAMEPNSTRNRISIAVLALGGQGGGVLTQWIARLGRHNGYRSQATSVPGVAQRTGATVYYVELVQCKAGDPDPVLALMPTPGDVDVVLASELMEAGRAMIRGLVSPDRTTLVSSTHRFYAITEKSTRGNRHTSSETVLAAARRHAKRFVAFDMAAAAEQAHSAISAVQF